MVQILAGLVVRRLEQVIAARLAEEPVLILSGPRSVGKSTLLTAAARAVHGAVVDLDDLATRRAVESDPALFAGGPGRVFIDEFQHVPALLDAIKAELNRATTPGRFVLAGSTRYETLPRTAQSLTGRAHILPVWPLSQGEIAGVREEFVARALADPASAAHGQVGSTARHEYVERILAGGFPLALGRTGAGRTRWHAGYVSMVCERDVLEISKIRQSAQLPRLLTRLCAQTGGLLNMAEAARTLGMDASVAENYTRLLEAVYQVHRLPAWGTTVGSKVAATPKVHAVDTGVAGHLLRLTPEKLAHRSPQAMSQLGHLLETFVVNEVLKQVSWLDDVVTAGHFRTHDGVEVDLILERSDGGILGVEVKAGSAVAPQDARGLRALARRAGEAWLGGYVLHTGAHAYTVDTVNRIYAAPVDALWTS